MVEQECMSAVESIKTPIPSVLKRPHGSPTLCTPHREVRTPPPYDKIMQNIQLTFINFARACIASTLLCVVLNSNSDSKASNEEIREERLRSRRECDRLRSQMELSTKTSVQQKHYHIEFNSANHSSLHAEVLVYLQGPPNYYPPNAKFSNYNLWLYIHTYVASWQCH